MVNDGVDQIRALSDRRLSLSQCVHDAGRLLDGLRTATHTALAAADDPLRLNLPPLAAVESGSAPSAAALRVLASLYMAAELEQAGLVPVVEWMVEQRADLSLPSERVAGRLEQFAQRARQWYDRDNRDRLFARIFGIGRAAINAEGSMVNRDFARRLAALCTSLQRVAEDIRWGQQPRTTGEADLQQTVVGVVLNLGSRQFGNNLLAARVIHEELASAIEILNDPETGNWLQTRGLWQTLRKLLGPGAPDFARLLARGQNGQRILEWLASIESSWLAVLANRTAPGLTPAPGSPVYVWSAAWLDAHGLASGRVDLSTAV